MGTRELLRKELIGCDIKAKASVGRIIDETKNMLLIETKEGIRKRLVKKGNVFEITINGKSVKVNGDLLLLRPEERIKLR